MEQYDCPLCFHLLCFPVSTNCGHTFCRKCLELALGRQRMCPICRTPTQSSESYSVSALLSVVIEREFPEEHKQRALELKQEAPASLELPKDSLPLYFCWKVVYFPGMKATLVVRGVHRDMFRNTRCVGLLSSVGSTWLGMAMEVQEIRELAGDSLKVELLAHTRFTATELRSSQGPVQLEDFTEMRGLLCVCRPEYIHDINIEVSAALQDSIVNYLEACVSRVSLREQEELTRKFRGVTGLGFYSLCVLNVPLDVAEEGYRTVNPIDRLQLVRSYIGSQPPTRSMLRISTNNSFLWTHSDFIVLLVAVVILLMVVN